MKQITRVAMFLVLTALISLTVSIGVAATREDIGDFYGQCVGYVKRFVPNFVGGDTLSYKINLITDYDNPHVGWIAVMNYGYTDPSTGELTGHVGMVDAVNGSQITITEANYWEGDITKATGTKDDLQIIGYIAVDSSYTSIAGAVVFYEHKDGNDGWSYSCNPNANVSNAGYMGFPNDQLSCIRINESNIMVEIYEHDNYNGRKLTFDRIGLFNLDSYDFNDICSSYKVYFK